jgi:hypothetical protein
MSRSWRRRNEYVFSRRFGDLGLKTTDRRFFGFGPQNTVGVSAGIGGGMCSNREVCVEAKQTCKQSVAIGCLVPKLDHLDPRV